MLIPMREELTKAGVQELRTAADVDRAVTAPGTTMIVVNSVCGCAGGIARPALSMAMKHPVAPDVFATVFASGDRDATERARSYFTGMPPSSPSFALLRDGKLLKMIHRSDIEIRGPQEVAALLTAAFDTFCASIPQV